MIELGYAPLVRSNPVPLYLRGFEGLGQDYAEPSMPDLPPDIFTPVTPLDLGTPTFIAPGQDPLSLDYGTPTLLSPGFVGPLAPGESVATPSGSMPSSSSITSAADLAALSNAASNAAKVALAPGPSPRVNTTRAPSATNPLSQNSVIAGIAIPNLALLAIAGIVLISVTRGR